MKSIQIFKEGTDELIASFEEDDEGHIKGITKDDIFVKVDGNILKKENLKIEP